MAIRARRTLPKTKLNVLRAESLTGISWLMHGFSTRVGGVSHVYGRDDLNLGYTKEDKRTNVERNRERFVSAVVGPTRSANSTAWPIVALRQVHSDVIHYVEGADGPMRVGDGMVTNQAGLLLAIQAADCLPIILVDPKRCAVGIFHAGWRPTLKRIAEKGVGAMRMHFGGKAADLRAAIGPGIQGCCYQVGEEVREKFEAQFPYAKKLFREVKESDPVRERYPLLFLTARAPGHGQLPKKIFLDLVEANRQQLLAMGVRAKNIHASPLCTSCRTDLLFSYRAEKGRTGRLMGVVGIRG